MAITAERKSTLCSLYGYNGQVGPDSAFAAAVASFNYEDKSISQDDLIWLLQTSGQVCTPYEGLKGLVNYVIDGDTISAYDCPSGSCLLTLLTPVRFRLWHVSAPGEEYPSGAAAKAWLEEQLPEESEFDYELKGEDPYGRKLIVIYKDGVNINEALIATGNATEWTATESLVRDEDMAGTVTTTEAVLEFTGNTEGVTVDGIELGVSNYLGMEHKNVGNALGRYWLGVRLVDENGVEWLYTGDPTYTYSIDPGETVMMKTYFTPPTTLGESVTIYGILNKEE